MSLVSLGHFSKKLSTDILLAFFEKSFSLISFAKIVLATQEKLPESTTKDLFSVIALPECADDLMPIITIGYFQLLSYLTSVKKGIDPDKPRNLAKSVTVE